MPPDRRRWVVAVWTGCITLGLILGSVIGAQIEPQEPAGPTIPPSAPATSSAPPSPSPSPTVAVVRPEDHPETIAELERHTVIEPKAERRPKRQPPPEMYPIPAGAYRPWRTFSANVEAARRYALARLESVQFNCLDRLFTRESGWRVHARNKSSGAYGIPQALPGRKMAWAGDDWRDNATTQVRWGIHYVNVRYGSACSALQHAYRTGWY